MKSSTQAVPTHADVPRHIAIIMDGNGRWAKKRLLPRVMGHKKGLAALEALIAECARMGVAYVLEGSRLGAAVLRRAVHGSPDPRVRASSRFLDHGQGQDLWRRFQVRLEDALDTEPRRAAAGLAACWAFDAFLARVGPPCRPPLAIR